MTYVSLVAVSAWDFVDFLVYQVERRFDFVWDVGYLLVGDWCCFNVEFLVCLSYIVSRSFQVR